ncbi:hypothetical protein BCH_02055 [Brucella sp. 191011898]|nr:hypothetical protein BCH_02055 [Brucella sp. 191011898]
MGVFKGMSDAKLWGTHIHTAFRRFSPYKNFADKQFCHFMRAP